MKIENKAKFFELWEAGVLGNRTRLWRDPEEAYRWAQLKDLNRLSNNTFTTQTEIGFREIRKAGSAGAGAWEKVPWPLVHLTAERWKAAGRNFILDDGCPDDCRTLQGEVCRTHRGLEGFLDTVSKLPMRPAMAAGHMHHTSHLQTLTLIRRFMDPSSRDDLEMLLDLYPDAAVEFSCFGRNVGIFPGRNTIFWETRNY